MSSSPSQPGPGQPASGRSITRRAVTGRGRRLRRSIDSWEWHPPRGHEEQPQVEWWFEQAAIVVLGQIARRAVRRGDMQTFERISRVMHAGRDAEIAARFAASSRPGGVQHGTTPGAMP